MVLSKKDKRCIIAAIAGVAFSLSAAYLPASIPVNGSLIFDTDTAYKRVWVYDTKDVKTSRPTRIFTDTIFGGQSGIYLDNPREILFDYQKYFDLANHFKLDTKKALMIGAGAYTYVAHYFEQNPEGTLDVVEIDPALEGIATKYFGLIETPALTIISEDGRTFLNKTNVVYDTIFIDAFTSLLSVPYQLTTKETIETVYKRLADDGVVITNIISAIEGSRAEFLRAEYATYASVFPTVLLFEVHGGVGEGDIQNLILVALKGANPALESNNTYLNALLKTRYQKPIANDMPILYDDFAPVEKYNAKLMW